MAVPEVASSGIRDVLRDVVSRPDVDSMSDTALVNAALDGEPGARRRLANRLLTSVHREVSITLARWSRSERASGERVRDLTQDVFVTLFESDGRELRRWDPGRGRTLDSFVRLVARRRCARLLDRELRRHGEQTADHVIIGDDSLVERLRHREALRDVLRALYAHMNTRDMALFELLFVQEFAPDEVARRMEMTRGAVNAWAYRTRKQAAKLAADAAGEPAGAPDV